MHLKTIWLMACLLSLPFAALSAPQAFVSFAAEASTIQVGDAVSLSWASSGVTNCEASGDWKGLQPIDGVHKTDRLPEARTYEFRLRCNAADENWIEKTVFVEVEDLSIASFDSQWITEPAVIPYQPAFSNENTRWRINLRLDSIGKQQGLVSYDEKGQEVAGHTTVSVDETGHIVVRHQAAKRGSYLTRSKTRVVAGKDYELVLEFRKNRGLSMWLNGSLEATSSQVFSMEHLRRDLVLGASCSSCRKGTSAPLRNSIQGGISFAIEPLVTPAPTNQREGNIEQASINAANGALFSSGVVNEPTVFPHDPQFSKDESVWRMNFELDSIITKQVLVSYDERRQETAGQTTVSVLASGLLQVRHQDDTNKSIFLTSSSRIRENTAYVVELRIIAGESLELFINGVSEAKTSQAFGTTSVVRPMVVGGSCERCRKGTAAPITDGIDGKLVFEVYSGDKELEIASADLLLASGGSTQPPEAPIDPSVTAPLSYNSPIINRPTLVEYQSVFSQKNSTWSAEFKLDSIGLRQGLFSYDETGQRAPGHTSLEVLSDGHIALRHQDGLYRSEILISKTVVRPGIVYTATVNILKDEQIALLVNGVVEDTSEQSFGTDGAKLDLVIGASCAYCEIGTSSPLRHGIDGEVRVQVRNSVSQAFEPSKVSMVPEVVEGPKPQEESASDPAPNDVPNSVSAEAPDPLLIDQPTAMPEVVANPTHVVEPATEFENPSNPPIAPTLSFDANKETVKSGDSVTLSWAAENASECSASGDWDGDLPVVGSRVVTASPDKRNFTLTCSGPDDAVVNIVSLEVSQRLTARWVAPTTNSNGTPLHDLVGYVIHYGASSGSYANTIRITDPAAVSTHIDLVPGTYYFAISAVNDRGLESGYSQEVVKVLE